MISRILLFTLFTIHFEKLLIHFEKTTGIAYQSNILLSLTRIRINFLPPRIRNEEAWPRNGFINISQYIEFTDSFDFVFLEGIMGYRR
jgi:hypothetical protein